MSFSEIDSSHAPPYVTIPRVYNAAVDFVDRHVEQRRGDRVAFTDDRTTLTYGALAERVARAGNALRAAGADAEQRVVLAMLDTVDFPAVFWGAIKAGIVPVPLNTLLTPEEYVFLLTDSRARVLVVSDALLPRLAPAIAASPHLKTVLVASSPLGGDAAGHDRLEARLAAASATLAPAPTTRDDVAFWLYSSGSTGQPKGAMHLHSHLVQTAALYGQAILGIRPEDVVFSAAKLFFAYGLGNAMTFPMSVGARAVLMAERPTAASVGRTLAQHRPTIFCGVPTLFASLLADGALELPPEVRVSVSAGEALPRHLGERWSDRFGTDILDGIGSTELLHIFLSNRHGDVRYGTTGRPVPGYDLDLRGDDGGPAPVGEEGSLWVRGPSAAIGYWNNRPKSLDTFHGPWTRTGDRYVRNEDGTFAYCGRADDMLKCGGIWVSPFEVESALAAHPKVLEAAVVGAGDDDGLVKPKAFVVLTAGAEVSGLELRAFAKERLASFKVPRWIEIVSELPKTATGKIQRFKLRG